MPREKNAREKCSSVTPTGREEQADYRKRTGKEENTAKRKKNKTL